MDILSAQTLIDVIRGVRVSPDDVASVLVQKIITGDKIDDGDIASELYEVCDHVHASCDTECPVYELMSYEEQHAGVCPCFKRGMLMLEFIRSRGR